MQQGMRRAAATCSVLLLLMAVSSSAANVKTAGAPANPLKDFNLTKVLADLNVTKILYDMKAKADADAAIKANATVAKNGSQVQFSLAKFFQDIKAQADADAATKAAKLAASINSTASDNSTTLSMVIGNKTITFKKPTKPSAFNATVPILTITSVFAMLQELTSTQPLLQSLAAVFSPTSTASRSLLETEDVLDPANFQYEMGRSLLADDSPSNSTTNTVQKTNAQKIGSRVNLLMSDAWLVAYSGFNVGRAAIQLLAALIKATATGTLTIDATLLLTFADLSAGFTANVNYLLYSIQKLAADSIAPLGVVKTSPSPSPNP